MSDTGDSRERRNADRQEVEVPFQMNIGGDVVEGTTTDLSLGGLLCQPTEPAKPEWLQQKATITIVIGSVPYDADCTIVRISDEGIGIQFDDITDSALEEAIFDLINDLMDDY